MGYSVGPAMQQAQGKPVGMAPQGFMMGGMRQGSDYDLWRDFDGDEAAYRKALAEEKAKANAFFNGVEQDRRSEEHTSELQSR